MAPLNKYSQLAFWWAAMMLQIAAPPHPTGIFNRRKATPRFSRAVIFIRVKRRL